MLGDRGFAVFVGSECCVCFAKALKQWPSFPSLRLNAADENYYAAGLRYKLNWATYAHYEKNYLGMPCRLSFGLPRGV